MNIRFTIPWKIGLGFGLFMVSVAALFVITRNTLQDSRAISVEINSVITPGIESLEQLTARIAYSKVLIRHWGTVQSRSNIPEKTRLLELMEREIPQDLQRIDSIAGRWDAEQKSNAVQLRRSVQRLFIVYRQIMVHLPNFESYADPAAMMKVDYLLLPDEGVDFCTQEVEAMLTGMLKAQREALTRSTNQMNALGDQLTFLAGNISIFILILGLIIAVLVSRSIVKPVSELKRTLLYLGKGIYPRNTVSVTPDEIGDMAFAVNRLVDGLKKTREFSAQVGGGNFDAQYTPLSEDDELGYALLKMRDDLAASERLLERKVEQRTNEVVQQKEELVRQKERVTELYKDLTDSINYARRIQQAILPTREAILDMFPDSFVFYRPRDIVSGDFYWFKGAGKKRFFAAVDCTGHGVPGAFMSLVGHNVLNHVTKVFTRPSQILNNLNRLALEALRPETATDAQLQDGMDIAFVSIDQETLVMEYAGAYNPLYIIRNGEMLRFEPNRFAIGSFRYGEREYTNHTAQLQKGDTLYTFSDGFIDQFGGPAGKKYLKKRFRDLLLEISTLSMDQQHAKLNEVLVTWMRGRDQVDDILVIGIRI
jgi:serine phosphatase RsbU (regulator of sigma subunit)/HAMP domain-containing protein